MPRVRACLRASVVLAGMSVVVGGCTDDEASKPSRAVYNSVSAEETVRQIMQRMEDGDRTAVGAVMTRSARDAGLFPPEVSSFDVGSMVDVGKQQAGYRGRRFEREVDVFVSYDPVDGDREDYYSGKYDTFVMVVDGQGRWFLDERGGEG